MFNAYILDWTMNDYAVLKNELAAAGLEFQPEGEDIRLTVPFERLQEVIELLQQHLNAPFNYVDVQFPNLGSTIIVFQQITFVIRNEAENNAAKQWAIEQGLPPAQADWGTSFQS